MPITASQLSILRDVEISAGARRLLLWLLSRSDSRGICVALPRDLLAEIGCGSAGVDSMLTELAEFDLVSELPVLKIEGVQYKVLRLTIPE